MIVRGNGYGWYLKSRFRLANMSRLGKKKNLVVLSIQAPGASMSVDCVIFYESNGSKPYKGYCMGESASLKGSMYKYDVVIRI